MHKLSLKLFAWSFLTSIAPLIKAPRLWIYNFYIVITLRLGYGGWWLPYDININWLLRNATLLIASTIGKTR
jgi:hypothetical protein